MKKLLSLVLVSVLFLGGCGSAEKSSKSLVEQIKEKGTLLIGNELSYSPYNWVVAGKEVPAGYESICTKISSGEVACGVDIAFGMELAKELGVNFDVVAYEWDSLIPALQQGEIDLIIAGMSPTNERKAVVDFSNVYLPAVNTLLVTGDSTIATIADLTGKKVGVQVGTLQVDVCREQLKDSECIELQDYNSLVLDLKNGNLDAVIAETAVSRVNVAAHPTLKMVENVGFTEGINGSAVAVRKGNDDMQTVINNVIKRLESNNTTRTYLDLAAQLLANQVTE